MEETADMRLRQVVSRMPLSGRLADICSDCGLHIIVDLDRRLEWLQIGGVIRCGTCLNVFGGDGWLPARIASE